MRRATACTGMPASSSRRFGWLEPQPEFFRRLPGALNPQSALLPIEIRPAERQQFISSGAAGSRKRNNRVEARRLEAADKRSKFGLAMRRRRM